MKITLSFKTPDVIFYAVEDLSPEDKAEVEEACKKWIEYDEYLHVEIDTETGTCTALPVKS